MSLVWPQNTRLCQRCLFRARYCHPSTPRRNTSNGKSIVSDNTSDATSNDPIYNPGREAPRRTDVRISGWRSFLKSKYLGQPASILVLRDAERKRGVRQHEARSNSEEGAVRLEEKALVGVKVSELLASIEAQKLVPGQAEVNQSIDELRPHPPAPDEPISLPLAQYEALANRINASFNQLQIVRYITIQEGSRVMKEQKQRSSRATRPQANRVAARSDWYGVDRRGNPIKKARQKVARRGKRGLVEYLLQTLWDVQIAEETAILGRIDLKVQNGQLRSLMAGGGRSSLIQLGQKHEVKIDVSNVDCTIQLTANKHRANVAADELEDILTQMHVMELDLQPLMRASSGRYRGHLTLEAVREVCDRMGCNMMQSKHDQTKRAKVSSNRSSVRIQALNLDQAEQCRRALFHEAGAVNVPDRLFFDATSRQDVSKKELSMSAMLPQVSSPQNKPLDRIAFPSEIVPLRPDRVPQARNDRPIASATFYKAFDVVSSPSIKPQRTKHKKSSDEGSSTKRLQETSTPPQLAATFGHIRCFQSGPIADVASLSTIKSPIKTPYLLSPTSLGLQQLLYKSFYTTVPRDDNLIRIQLIPSPWDSTSHAHQPRPPDVTLVFKVDQQARQVRYMHLVRTWATRKAGIMVPSHAVDVELSGTSTDKNSEPVTDPVLRQFIRDIEDSGSGYSRVAAAPFVALKPLTLGLPSQVKSQMDQQIADGAEKTEPDSPLQYFTTAVELVQKLTFDMGEFELEYSRLGAGESGGKREVLALHMKHGVESVGDQVDWAGKKKAFYDEVNHVLATLQIGAERPFYANSVAPYLDRRKKTRMMEEASMDEDDDVFAAAG